MIEPAGPWVGDEHGLGGAADVDFLQLIADAARRVNALLIFDEIITGFRYPHGSVQKATGVLPDLTCLGKALASGMPLSALLGPYRLFLEYFHKTHFCPTFRGEVYSLAAARAAIPIYRTEPVADHIWHYGEALRRGIHDVCRQAGIDGECTGPPFRMAFVFRERDSARRQLKTLLMQELLKERGHDRDRDDVFFRATAQQRDAPADDRRLRECLRVVNESTPIDMTICSSPHRAAAALVKVRQTPTLGFCWSV